MWKDRFLAQTIRGLSTADTTVTGGDAKLDGFAVTRAVQLVDLFDRVRRAGSQLDVVWGSVTRRGYLRSFSHTWTTEHDCEWEMEFLWSSNESVAPSFTASIGQEEFRLSDSLAVARAAIRPGEEVIAQSKITGALVPSWFQSIQLKIAAVSSAISEAFSQASTIGQPIAQTSRQISGLIGSTVAESLALIDEASSTGLDVLGVANSVGSTLGSFKSTPTILAQQWSQVVQGAGVAMASLSPVDPDANSILSSVFYQSEAQRIARAQVRRLQELQSQINASLEPVPDTFYVTRDGDNLRGISTLFYGTPSRWTEIQEKNKELLAGYNDSSNMPAGLTLTIPGVNQNG
jgi:nucleoid-associated protein YgaU